MRVISTRAHGFLELFLVILLIFAPDIFGFTEEGGTAVAIPRIVALTIILLSVFTRYEFGVIKVISMVNHLRIDYITSLFLAASPFLFGFYDGDSSIWLPHVIVGLGYFLTAIMTETSPGNVPET